MGVNHLVRKVPILEVVHEAPVLIVVEGAKRAVVHPEPVGVQEQLLGRGHDNLTVAVGPGHHDALAVAGHAVELLDGLLQLLDVNLEPRSVWLRFGWLRRGSGARLQVRRRGRFDASLNLVNAKFLGIRGARHGASRRRSSLQPRGPDFPFRGRPRHPDSALVSHPGHAVVPEEFLQRGVVVHGSLQTEGELPVLALQLLHARVRVPAPSNGALVPVRVPGGRRGGRGRAAVPVGPAPEVVESRGTLRAQLVPQAFALVAPLPELRVRALQSAPQADRLTFQRAQSTGHGCQDIVPVATARFPVFIRVVVQRRGVLPELRQRHGVHPLVEHGEDLPPVRLCGGTRG
mmetsp:Transcript_14337/g.62297  ORF Transcript_14337/g.62297 Transcript_14337/m.62297 type:complete len:346 (+) Transcript_14337:2487-3524(+)